MIFKTNWTQYLHLIRKEEIKKIFDFLGSKKFDSGIEFGAGDGFQTTILATHFNSFVSSDLNFKRIKDEQKLSTVQYIKCDADNINNLFNDKRFDLVFSSNMIEHLSNPKNFLKNTYRILKDDGYNIHVVPSRCVKITYILFFYVNVFTLVADRFLGLFRGKKIFRGAEIYLDNNINVVDNKKSRFERIFLPSIHGNYKTHSEEFIKFGRKSWEQLFINSGFKVVKHIKGPVFSGYGFGLNSLRSIFHFFGWSSEHIFILKK